MRTILGTMEFGKRLNLSQSEKMVQGFVSSQTDFLPIELDTAYIYAGGKTEDLLGKLSCKNNKEVQIASKANPMHGKTPLDTKGVRHQLETTLKRLNMESIHLYYLHSPDHKTPIIETLKIVNQLYEEKKFKEFGLSNYAAWQVAEIYTICKNNSWVLPTVYQGMYNCLTRSVEKELLKCLRNFNIRFYAYNPLCGGLLTGKHRIEDSNKSGPGRFFGKGMGEMYRNRFWKKEYFESVDEIQSALSSVYGNEVSLTEASFRWLYHHSMLDRDCGDGVILGASTLAHFNENISFTKKGKLDDKVVEVMNEGWKNCCYICPDYMR